MELSYTNVMLYTTGIATAVVGILAFSPATLMDKLFKIRLTDEVAIFITRHWSLLVSIVGLLIICSVHNPAIRSTILLAAIIEKGVMVSMIVKNIKKDFTRGLRGVLLIDSVCIILYALHLIGVT